MPNREISAGVYYVGVGDPEVRSFHGYLTPQGSTYNAYLVVDEKVTLIDSVKAPFAEELMANISEIIDPSRIDYHIVNHVEPDHSGGLPLICERCPNAQLLATANGQKEIAAYYGELSLPLRVVKVGDTLNTGRHTFHFVPMPMVHWPDSMSTYLPDEAILFSNDALGQHIARPGEFDDEIGVETLMERAGDYYANIVLPFGMQVQKLLGEISKIDVKTVCPSHGVMLRSHIFDMAAAYDRWSNNETLPNRAVVLYDTMWGSTRMMAERIAAEWKAEGLSVEMIDMEETHASTAMAALLDCRYIAIGSPTLNRGVMPTIGALLTYMKGLAPKKRIGRSFGSYGWSGESAGDIDKVMETLGWERQTVEKTQWWPR